jgi:hypothetical protein
MILMKKSISDKAACGWPAKTWPGRPALCPCGFIFPEKIQAMLPHWHAMAKPVSFDDWTDDEDDLDFG